MREREGAEWDDHYNLDNSGWREPQEGQLFGRMLRILLVVAVIAGSTSWFAARGISNLEQASQTKARQDNATRSRTRDGAALVAGRQRTAAQPSSSDGGYELVIPAASGGHYYVDAQVNGALVSFLVDTGASAVILSPDDARAAGFNPRYLDYNHQVQTANGSVRAAAVTLDRISAGGLELENVRAIVLDSPLDFSLLGMSFLGRLSSYRVEDQKMVLRW